MQKHCFHESNALVWSSFALAQVYRQCYDICTIASEMGYIRYTLALIVVFQHSDCRFFYGVGAQAAVQIFFLMSGIYMAAVYTKKYSLIVDGRLKYYLNRFYRLYPTYLAVLLLTFLVYLIFLAFRVSLDSSRQIFDFFIYFKSFPLWMVVISLFSNIAIFLQDLLSIDSSFHYLFPVRQGWSIASELIFYLIVPLLFRLKSVSILALSIAFFVLKYFALVNFGWRFSYFNPVCNVGYFLLGYSFYLFMSKTSIPQLFLDKSSIMKPFSTALVILTLSSLPKVSFGNYPVYNVLLSIACGFVFTLLLNCKPTMLENKLGTLSYGLYLNHFLVLVVLDSLFVFSSKYVLATCVVFLGTFLAIAVEHFIQKPFDKYRHSLTAQSIKECV